MNNILISHESPIELFDKSLKYNDYQYCLYHLFLKNEQYRNFFNKCSLNNVEIILDNSAFEFEQTKEKFNEEDYVKCIEELNPTTFIVPDIMNDGYNTCISFDKFIKKYPNLKHYKMGILQGRTYNEMVECYKYLSDTADYIGLNHGSIFYNVIGRGLTLDERKSNGRIKLIKMLIDDGIWNWNKPHHLLGVQLPIEFSFYKNNNIYNIRSIDTSNPIMAGINNMTYNNTLGLKEKPKGLMAENMNIELTNDQVDLIMYNIKCFRKIVNG